MRFIWTFLLLHGFWGLFGQETDKVLQFNEFMAYVKQYHPIAKQAGLTLSESQAKLLMARGGFDPKIEVDYDKKDFKGTQYWDRVYGAFKIPTYFGIELKGTYERYEGTFINPDETVPEDGLYGVGVSVPLAKNFWINKRMAILKKAKFFEQQAAADQIILVNEVLYEASKAYFEWLKSYNELRIFEGFVENAFVRFEGVKRSSLVGDVAAIDTVEAKINYQNRLLDKEKAQLNYIKSGLDLSNFLWIDNIPVEVTENTIPNVDLSFEIDGVFQLPEPVDTETMFVEHPKIRSLGFKIDGLQVEKRLATNQLLPQIDVEFNFLTDDLGNLNSINTNDNKLGANFKFPLFLRKERGKLKLTKLKLADAEFELDNTKVTLANKLNSLENELESMERQNTLASQIVDNYTVLVKAEERKFQLGESSLFLVNSRENKLIDAKIKSNELQIKAYNTKASIFRVLAMQPSI